MKQQTATFSVYALLNTHTQRKYYGRSMRPQSRYTEHISSLRDNFHYNKYMQRDHNRGHQDWQFDILLENLTQKQANKISDQLAKDDEECYNILGLVASNKKGRSNKLKDSDVAVIRDLYFSGEKTQQQVAQMFNVTQGVISLTVNGRIHNPGEEFVPPFFQGQQVQQNRFRQHFVLMDYKQYLENGLTPGKAINRLVKKYKFSRNEVKIMIAAPSACPTRTRNVDVDGTMYWSVGDWSLETGGNLKHVTLIKSRHYRSWKFRTQIIDGVETVVGDERMPSYFMKRGLIGTRIAPGVWTTRPRARRSKIEIAQHREQRDQELMKIEVALKDAVWCKTKRKISIADTCRKHGIVNRQRLALLARKLDGYVSTKTLKRLARETRA